MRIVLSGVNIGVNLGNGLWHSGTLAAAKHAALFGLRGIALSTPSTGPGGEDPDVDALAPDVDRVLDVLLADDTARLLNVNVPPQPRGMTWTRQAVRHYDGRIVPDEDPMGRHHLWFTVVPIEETEPGTDLWAMERGYISITRLSFDRCRRAGAAARRDPARGADRRGAGRSHERGRVA